jgi:hypothetical protein
MLKFFEDDRLVCRRIVDEIGGQFRQIQTSKSQFGFRRTSTFTLATSCKLRKNHDKIVHSLTLRKSILRLLPAYRTNTNDRLSFW